MNSATFFSESLAARAARNFFTHSGHVPLVVLILAALLAKPGYFAEPDPYLLLAAGLFQAVIMELPAARRQLRPFFANLAGPLLYSLIETGLEGPDFFRQWHHQAYWGFACGFALLQLAQEQRTQVTAPLVLAENVLRSAIPLIMYALFEARSKNALFSLDVFFNDRAHVFLAIVLLLLGMLLGFADVNLRHSLATVRSLTRRLRQYSEWSLGRGGRQGLRLHRRHSEYRSTPLRRGRPQRIADLGCRLCRREPRARATARSCGQGQTRTNPRGSSQHCGHRDSGQATGCRG